MELLIEDGILLRPYTLAWRREGWRSPPGWTPKRTPAMYELFEKLKEQLPDAPDLYLWDGIERVEGQQRFRERQPWPGWVPLPAPSFPNATPEDKAISSAYRELCQREGAMPADGRYVFERRRMMRDDRAES